MDNSDFSIFNIPLDKVFVENSLHYRFPTEVSKFKVSINKYGLLTPLTVYRDNSRYILLDGYKRYQVLRDNNASSVPVNVIAADNLQEALVQSICMLKETSTKLTLLEKAELLSVFKNFFKISESDILAKYLSLLELPRKSEVVSLLLAANIYPDGIKLFLHENDLGLNDYYLLRKIPLAQVQDLIDFILLFNLSYSNLRQLIELVIEIAIKDQLTVAQVVNSKEILDVLHLDKLQGNLKVARIKEHLISLRYPQISEYRAQMQARVNALNLPGAIRFNYPADAESGVFGMELKFGSNTELVQLVDKINTVTQNNSITDLFEYYESIF